MKKCTKCKQEKALLDFKVGKKYPNGHPHCNQCIKEWHAKHYQKPEIKIRHREQGRKWRKENKEKANLMFLKSRLKKHYRMSLEEYRSLLSLQGDVCAICGSSDPKRKGALGLFIDHCHKTNKIRGLLCHPCNLLLGYAEDNENVLDQAKDYLRKSSTISRT